MTSPFVGLVTKQQLSASPRMQQALRLLQMSALELDQQIHAALTSNPFLEESEDGERPGADARAQEGLGAIEPPERREGEMLPASPDMAAIAADFLPEGMQRGGRFDDEDDGAFWERMAMPTSLREHLRNQLCGGGLSARTRLAAEIVIETLDDDGYLRADPAESAAALGLQPPISADELAFGLRAVQNLDPCGVGARSLAECLALQLQAQEPATSGRELALCIVREHLPALARHDLTLLRAQLGCDDAALQAACALIRRLDPRPGRRFEAEGAGYVVPDVLVTRVGDGLRCTINPAVLPHARLNRSYVDLLRRHRQSEHPAMAQQLQQARWLLRNVEQRFATILRVAEAIVQRQRAFFAYGEVALRPLVLREIADALGLHESTVSRATGNKFMATPRGMLPFKHFFSRELATGTGGRCSATAVRALIREMIDGERSGEPLSDASLARMLSAQGVRVARRTVTKYRCAMKVPPAELRRAAL